MKTLIIGYGEIGKALYNCLKEYNPNVIQRKNDCSETVDTEVMHICFPYSDEFIEQVQNYQKTYNPKYTVIHSTVPVGTSSKLNAVHSPVIGIHPYLEQSMLTFTKFLGGKQASELADYFRRANIKVYLVDKPETTELMKVLCTTKYGIDIEYVKDVKRQCDAHGVPFEAWTLWNENYNQGYKKLGQEQYVRPNLVPVMKKIGGHCVVPNSHLLETEFTKLIRLLNSEN